MGNVHLAGITDPYLYIGGFNTMFGWHVEDLNMPSINYNHHGAPKFWYHIGRKDYKKFDFQLNFLAQLIKLLVLIILSL